MLIEQIVPTPGQERRETFATLCGEDTPFSNGPSTEQSERLAEKQNPQPRLRVLSVLLVAGARNYRYRHKLEVMI